MDEQVAHDLERLVVDALAARLRDAGWVCERFEAGLDVDATDALIDRARRLADTIACDREERSASKTAGRTIGDGHGLRPLLARVTLGRRDLVLTLDRSVLAAGLATGNAASDEPLTISVEAHALRCGRQVRLIVGEVPSEDRTPDARLVGLLADAQRWFGDLRSGRRTSIAQIARCEGRNSAEISRSLSLAFLAPDIVQTILTGRQPATLTVERLRACRPLPRDWDEQRRLLLG